MRSKSCWTFVVVALAASSASAAAITLTLEINPAVPGCTGCTLSGPGTYNLFASIDDADNFGIAAYSIPILNVASVLHRAPRAGSIADAAFNSDAAGFSSFRTADNASAIPNGFLVGATQDVFTPTPYQIRGLGQTAGSFVDSVPAGSTIGNAIQPSWAANLLIAEGQYDPAGPEPLIDFSSINLMASAYRNGSGTRLVLVDFIVDEDSPFFRPPAPPASEPAVIPLPQPAATPAVQPPLVTPPQPPLPEPPIVEPPVVEPPIVEPLPDPPVVVPPQPPLEPPPADPLPEPPVVELPSVEPPPDSPVAPPDESAVVPLPDPTILVAPEYPLNPLPVYWGDPSASPGAIDLPPVEYFDLFSRIDVDSISAVLPTASSGGWVEFSSFTTNGAIGVRGAAPFGRALPTFLVGDSAATSVFRSVPEPATMYLCCMSLIGLAGLCRGSQRSRRR